MTGAGMPSPYRVGGKCNTWTFSNPICVLIFVSKTCSLKFMTTLWFYVTRKSLIFEVLRISSVMNCHEITPSLSVLATANCGPVLVQHSKSLICSKYTVLFLCWMQPMVDLFWPQQVVISRLTRSWQECMMSSCAQILIMRAAGLLKTMMRSKTY